MHIGTKRRLLLGGVDTLLLFLTYYLSVFLSFGKGGVSFSRVVMLPLWLIVAQELVLQLCGLYNVSVRHCSLDLLERALWVPLVDTCFCLVSLVLGGRAEVSIRFYCNLGCWNYLAIVVWRVLVRFCWEKYRLRDVHSKPYALIYGAGECGRALVRHAEEGHLAYHIVGFLDDDEKTHKKIILNKKVYGGINALEGALAVTEAKCIIIAISSGISAKKMQKIALCAKKDGVTVLIAPSMFDLSRNKKKKEFDLRTLDYADLLGRQLITIDRKPVEEMISGKRILVTGAGGSIGSEICRQIRGFNPKQLLLLDIDETELHNLSLELTDYQKEFSAEVFPICCDIKNTVKVRDVFKTFRPQIVFHAAAYKHVPMMEMYPEEAVRTNVLGSYNVLKAAEDYQAEKVIIISTDKAVNPTNVMGCTKRVVELEAAMLTTEKTPIVAVRFGNVLGSRGSMLPLFFDQIKNGVPITVTDKNIIRYFMAIPEAVCLVFRAGAMAKSGEVMVLDMGEPVRIYDFAKKLIDIYGDPEKNKIVITGLRPGEKLYEELLADKDNTIPTTNKHIYQAKVKKGDLDKTQFETLLKNINEDTPETLVRHLHEIVPEFTHKDHEDWRMFGEGTRNENEAVLQCVKKIDT